VVAIITTRIRNVRTEVAVGAAERLARPSVVNLDEVRTVEKMLLQRRIGFLTRAKMREVEDAIHFALALSH
jgi:mRNA-degrading endonuclease toxin of MazEF toxin-antitoxin module